MGQCRSAEDAVMARPEEDRDDSEYSSRHFLSRRHAPLSLNREVGSIQIFTSMGFDEISAERALRRFQGDREQALQYLVEEQIEGSQEHEEPAVNSGRELRRRNTWTATAGAQVDESKVGDLVLMGFELNKVIAALKDTNNDTQRALEMLITPGVLDHILPVAANGEGHGMPAQIPLEPAKEVLVDADVKRRLLLLGFSAEEATEALRAVGGNRGEAALMYLFDEMERKEAGGGARDTTAAFVGKIGRDIFATAVCDDQDKDVDDRFKKAAGSGPARTFTEQVNILKRMGYKHSRNWDMELDVKNKTFMYSRHMNVKGERRIDSNTFLSDIEARRIDGTIMEVHGWLRSFKRSWNGNVTLQIVPASQGSSFYEGQLSKDVMMEILTVRRMTLQQKKQWFDVKREALRGGWRDRVEMTLNRRTIFEQTMVAMMGRPVSVWRNPLNLKFKGEAGIDAGGLTRDWYQEILDTAFSPECRMFRFSQTDDITYQIDEDSTVPARQYRFVGLVIGKAILDDQPIGVHFNIPMLKNIVGYPITYRDLLYKNKPFHDSLQKMIEMQPEMVEYLYLTFTLPSTVKGKVIELKPGGSEIEVTGENIKEYVNLAAKHMMFHRESTKLEALLRGIYDVIPEHLLTIFDFPELELLLGGVPVIDVEDWKANTMVSGEGPVTTYRGRRVIRWFWNIITSWSHEERARFLNFATATSHVPPGGFKNLGGHLGEKKKFELRLVRYGQVGYEAGYPKAHTCFNRIDLPIYSSQSEMRTKMEGVLKFSTEFKDIKGFHIE